MGLGEQIVDIEYQPRKCNGTADAISRFYCASVNSQGSTLSDLHEEFFHPGVSRLLHFVRSINLLFSAEDVKKYVRHEDFVRNSNLISIDLPNVR